MEKLDLYYNLYTALCVDYKCGPHYIASVLNTFHGNTLWCFLDQMGNLYKMENRQGAKNKVLRELYTEGYQNLFI